MRLKVELNWAEMFRDLTKDFDVDVLIKRQAAALKEAGLQQP